MNVDQYFLRIGVDADELALDEASLKQLQRHHLLSVPFENLDIHWKRPIVLDTQAIYEKIIDEKRGGYCYELNGLFSELLRSLGFATRLVSGRVFNGSDHGPEFDHAAIIVTIGADEYLADVGFGDFTAEPLKYVLDETQHDATGTYVMRRFGEEYIDVAKLDDNGWKSSYIFKDIPRDLSEFDEMNKFQQHSPESHFTKGKLCSIMTKTGRKTLTDSAFIVTTDGEKTDVLIDSDDLFFRTLLEEFHIKPPFLVERN